LDGKDGCLLLQTWKNIQVVNCGIGFDLISENGKIPEAGSILIQDSVFESTAYAIVIYPTDSTPGHAVTNIVLDNVAFKNVVAGIRDRTGKTILFGGEHWIDGYAIGPIYLDALGSWGREYHPGKTFSTNRPRGLVGGNVAGLPQPIFFERAKPQYEQLGADQFISVKGSGAKAKQCARSVYQRCTNEARRWV
jgi:glucan 1,3-beta-glucosidase